MSDHAVLYRDGSGEWRSRVVASNGEIIFDSGESYKHRGDCLDVVTSRFPGIPVEYEDGEV
jgi:uncharacterized protein YegP (UPF0339 family)